MPICTLSVTSLRNNVKVLDSMGPQSPIPSLLKPDTLINPRHLLEEIVDDDDDMLRRTKECMERQKK